MERHEIEVDHDGKRLFEGLLFLTLYCLTIPGAAYLSANFGCTCETGGPCKVYVAPGLLSTTGSLLIGATYVLRDFVQRRFGIAVSACAVVMGAALAGLLASAPLVFASGMAIFIAGFIDLVIYTWIARKNFVTAVVSSSLISAVIDSAVFLCLAYNSLDLLGGQVLGKVWVILAALPFTLWMWKRDRRIGLAAA